MKKNNKTLERLLTELNRRICQMERCKHYRILLDQATLLYIWIRKDKQINNALRILLDYLELNYPLDTNWPSNSEFNILADAADSYICIASLVDQYRSAPSDFGESKLFLDSKLKLKEALLSYFYSLSNFLYDSLVLGTKYSPPTPHSSLTSEKKFLKFSKHIMYVCKEGTRDTDKCEAFIEFYPNKIVQGKLSIIETIIQLMCKNTANTISLQQIRTNLPKFSSNDFYTYRVILNEKFKSSWTPNKSNLVVLKDEKASTRGNPVMGIFMVKKN